MARDIIKIVASWVFGTAAVSFSVGAITGYAELFLIVFASGIVFGVPVLALVILLFVVFRANIRKHLTLWCVAAPFIVALVFAALSVATPSAPSFSPGQYFSMRET